MSVKSGGFYGSARFTPPFHRGIQRPGGTRRFLMHAGELVFFPSGVPSVRIAFARAGARVSRMTIADPDVYLTAKREG